MSYGSTVGPDAPVHWWRCADPGGALLHDIGSGPQRAMKTTGGFVQLAYTGPASEGGSAWFDSGQAAWHSSGDTISSPMTIECWVWLHNLLGAIATLFGHYANMQTTAANKIQFASGAGNVLSVGALSEQVWHHLVGTYGPTGGAKLYIDGAIDTTVAYGAAWGPQTPPPSLGMSGSAGLFAGANLAEFATYSTELSAARIAAHYAAADTKAIRPVFKGLGSFDFALGTSVLAAGSTATILDDSAAILASVRKTY